MKPPLLTNENFPAPALRRLRELGFDVVAVSEVMPGADDEAVLSFARESGRWLVTFDRDYGELVFLRGLPTPPAVIYIRQEAVPPAVPADWLAAFLDTPDAEAGYFVTLGGTTIRRRSLPTAG